MASSTTKERQSNLEEYLDDFLENKRSYPRIHCCGSSKSLYCTECQRLLIPKSEWPPSLLDGHLQLPFDLDIILNDRKKSATGFHAVVLLKEDGRFDSGLLNLGTTTEATAVALAAGADKDSSVVVEGEQQHEHCIETAHHHRRQDSNDDASCDRNNHNCNNLNELEDEVVEPKIQSNGSKIKNYSSTTTNTNTDITSSRLRKKVRLFNIGIESDDAGRSKQQEYKDDPSPQSLPSYSAEEEDTVEERRSHPQQQQGTFLLFPSEDSIPLSTVASEVTRLIVLDCKWTNSVSHQRLPELAHVQKVR